MTRRVRQTPIGEIALTHGLARDSPRRLPGPAVILIVDGEPAIAKALSTALERAGHRALRALSGRVALATLTETEVQVLVIELALPDVPGDEIFYRALELQPHLRYQTVFMTHERTPRSRERIAATECRVLEKPFDLRSLCQEVAAILQTPTSA